MIKHVTEASGAPAGAFRDTVGGYFATTPAEVLAVRWDVLGENLTRQEAEEIAAHNAAAWHAATDPSR